MKQCKGKKCGGCWMDPRMLKQGLCVRCRPDEEDGATMKDLNGERLEFGDIICNEWAGDGNPHKVVMFIKATKRYVNWVSLDGDQGQTYRDDHRIRKVGELDLFHWKRIHDEHMAKGQKK